MSIEVWVAWSVSLAASCVVLVRKLRLRKIGKPSAEVLIAELKAAVPESSEGVSAEARPLDVAVYRNWELDERLIEVQSGTRHEPELGSALSRVALASGTALALLALIGDGALVPRLMNGASSFIAGVVGAGVVSYLGRLARLEARALREHWQRISISARRELGA